MTDKLKKLLYRFGILKPREAVDRMHYLSRLAKGGNNDNGRYFSPKDAQQYAPGTEILIRSRFRNQPIYFSCRADNHIERTIVRDGLYAANLLELIADRCREGSIIDVGANIGAIAIPLAKAFPQCRVYAFEPNPPAFARLMRNVGLNRLENLHARPLAVADHSGTAQFFAFSGADLGQSSIVKPQRFEETPTKIEVQVATLDDLFVAAANTEVIKIDVQGNELSVLQGARQLIARHRPLIVFEHEDTNFGSVDEAIAARQGLRKFFADVGYNTFYVTRQDGNMWFPVNWDKPLNGDLVALPEPPGR